MSFNEIKDKIKYFITIDLKKFIWYLCTEPFRSIWAAVKSIWYGLKTVEDVKNFLVLLIVLVVFCTGAGNYTAARAFAILTTVVFLHFQWRSGFFRHRWKERETERAKRLNEEKGGNKNGLDNNN